LEESATLAKQFDIATLPKPQIALDWFPRAKYLANTAADKQKIN